MSDEREVQWPDPRPDPDQEPAEPWARENDEGPVQRLAERIWDKVTGGDDEPPT
jgi:hypothetical protein